MVSAAKSMIMPRIRGIVRVRGLCAGVGLFGVEPKAVGDVLEAVACVFASCAGGVFVSFVSLFAEDGAFCWRAR